MHTTVIRTSTPSHGSGPEYFLKRDLQKTTLKRHAAQFDNRQQAEEFAAANGIEIKTNGGLPYIDEVDIE